MRGLRGIVLSLGVAALYSFSPVTSQLVAQQDLRAIARARLDPGPSVTVGQPVVVRIEVLVPSFFSGAPFYPEVTLRDALVLFVFGRNNFTERIDGITWAGQRREYHVYPQRPGSYEIPEITVGVRYRPPGGRSGETATDSVSPPPIRFEAVLPPQAEGLSYFISAQRVELQDSFDVLPDTVLVGETLTRTVTASVHGALSMVIPPLLVDAVAGLASYPAAPEVEDIEGFGVEAVVGRRAESVTYVAQSEGDYVLPGIALQWWDVNAEQLRTATVPPVMVHVPSDPARAVAIPLPEDSVAAQASAGGGSSGWMNETVGLWALALAGMILLGAVALRLHRRYGPRIDALLLRAQHKRAESEATYFRRFRAAARSGDPRAAARTLFAWLDRWQGAGSTVSSLAAAASDDVLVRELLVLGRHVYQPGPLPETGTWSGAGLIRAVARVRKRRSPRRFGRTPGSAQLRALNPWKGLSNHRAETQRQPPGSGWTKGQ